MQTSNKPPTRQGVNASRLVLPAQPSAATLLDFLCQRFTHIARHTWQQRFARGDIVNEALQPLAPDSVCRPHQSIFYYRELPAEQVIPFSETVLFQNNEFLIADKPHFLPVVPSGQYLQESLLVRLRQKYQLPDLTPVHRLDRETAGLVLFSVNPATRGLYQALFRERQIIKEYEALVAPTPSLRGSHFCYRSHLAEAAHFMQNEEAAGPYNSETAFRWLAENSLFTHLSLVPISGKRHQLRVHCAALGCPILGDLIYPQLQAANQDDYTRPLQLLAKHLRFTDPLSGKDYTFDTQRSLALTWPQ